ncbi:hypothetical protein [Desulfosporosinus meridiei]|uniref:Uncharacterized protein n=1 Tax=Desulfosporosinus meridiei (strain ATCC BAA-275 / DSM 13257 / KCTC 12902 / NCIMB 13706 / S10) TaxID=768704 RepID=J7J1U4_DESMD|nr:hypothetical protein [Desulfosporosinus meridiei]AFQ44931.1 hypothetical protein Desmer_3048 [Desulfosporosinus meridiei DSM 13257]
MGPSSSYADVISEVGTISLPSTGSTYLESQTLIPVKQGEDYTLSGNLSTDPLTAASGNGASLQVLIYNQAGTYVQTIKSKVVSEKSDLAKYVVPFNSPVKGTAKVRLDVTSAQGDAKFDNIRFGYDLEGRLKQEKVSKTLNGPILHTFDYDYDKVGNLISSIEKILLKAELMIPKV